MIFFLIFDELLIFFFRITFERSWKREFNRYLEILEQLKFIELDENKKINVNRKIFLRVNRKRILSSENPFHHKGTEFEEMEHALETYQNVKDLWMSIEKICCNTQKSRNKKTYIYSGFKKVKLLRFIKWRKSKLIEEDEYLMELVKTDILDDKEKIWQISRERKVTYADLVYFILVKTHGLPAKKTKSFFPHPKKESILKKNNLKKLQKLSSIPRLKGSKKEINKLTQGQKSEIFKIFLSNTNFNLVDVPITEEWKNPGVSLCKEEIDYGQICAQINRRNTHSTRELLNNFNCDPGWKMAKKLFLINEKDKVPMEYQLPSSIEQFGNEYNFHFSYEDLVSGSNETNISKILSGDFHNTVKKHNFSNREMFLLDLLKYSAYNTIHNMEWNIKLFSAVPKTDIEKGVNYLVENGIFILAKLPNIKYKIGHDNIKNLVTPFPNKMWKANNLDNHKNMKIENSDTIASEKLASLIYQLSTNQVIISPQFTLTSSPSKKCENPQYVNPKEKIVIVQPPPKRVAKNPEKQIQIENNPTQESIVREKPISSSTQKEPEQQLFSMYIEKSQNLPVYSFGGEQPEMAMENEITNTEFEKERIYKENFFKENEFFENDQMDLRDDDQMDEREDGDDSEEFSYQGSDEEFVYQSDSDSDSYVPVTKKKKRKTRQRKRKRDSFSEDSSANEEDEDSGEVVDGKKVIERYDISLQVMYPNKHHAFQGNSLFPSNFVTDAFFEDHIALNKDISSPNLIKVLIWMKNRDWNVLERQIAVNIHSLIVSAEIEGVSFEKIMVFFLFFF